MCQREEEERKEEERKRTVEERRRLEKERILKERRDAEERDRKMNEKLQMIEEQRLEQCLFSVNSALQWLFYSEIRRTKSIHSHANNDNSNKRCCFTDFSVSQKKTGGARRRAAQEGEIKMGA